ncbi:GIY-YIG nuclease family protein [Streptomyces sp. NPDC051664]|uniref:GIY-YIG nuclease family protein n=1 Tax=Streptomyces sp. NPDC051664 TaxID=3365668 RepID=UPI0037A9EC67
MSAFGEENVMGEERKTMTTRDLGASVPVHLPARRFDPVGDWRQVLTAAERGSGTGGLYRFYDGRRGLLYVGITRSFVTRWRAHRSTRWWVEARYVALSLYPEGCHTTVEDAERASVCWEQPLFNVQLRELTALDWARKVPPSPFGVTVRQREEACGYSWPDGLTLEDMERAGNSRSIWYRAWETQRGAPSWADVDDLSYQLSRALRAGHTRPVLELAAELAGASGTSDLDPYARGL